MSKTAVILNPNAASGETRPVWNALESLAHELWDALEVHITDTPEAVPAAIEAAYANGVRQVLAMGGDGTNHSVINGLMRFRDAHPDSAPITFGSIPVGTGRDWTRNLNTPLDPAASLRWLAASVPQPIDVGQLVIDGADVEYFVNVASCGLGGDVATRVNNLPKRYPWTFFRQTAAAIIAYQPSKLTLKVGDDVWLDEKAYIAVVGNGGIFGHGMLIAPPANIQDGLLDVVLMEGVSLPHFLYLFARVYSGRHLLDKRVHHRQVAAVEVFGDNAPVLIELDGEVFSGQHLAFTVRHHALPALTGQHDGR
jgi:diacylglycerol kinase (ATP)